MLFLVLLLVLYSLLLFWCFSTSRHVLLTPQLLFLSGFILQVTYSFRYIDEYDINIHKYTFLVFVIGALLFVFTCRIVARYQGKKNVSQVATLEMAEKHRIIHCDYWKLLVFLFIQVVAIVASIRHLSTLANGSIGELIYAYRSAAFGYNSKYDYISTSLPFVLRTIRRLSFASGFVWAFLLAHFFVHRIRRGRWIIALNMALSMACDMLLGGRKGSLQLLFAFFLMLYFIKGKKDNWNKTTRIKTLLIGLIGTIVFLCGFSFTTQLVGRQVTKTNADYVSVYLAAPIKNLDLYIRFGNGLSRATNYLSLPGIAGFLRDYLHLFNLNLDFTYPYNIVNGVNIGNAYSTYYAFIFDHGIWGLLIYVPLMALISKTVFYKMLTNNDSGISISIILFSFLGNGVFLAFFDNSFFINLASLKFVEYYVFWLTLRWFFHTKFVFGSHRYQLVGHHL